MFNFDQLDEFAITDLGGEMVVMTMVRKQAHIVICTCADDLPDEHRYITHLECDDIEAVRDMAD
jgi:hypothetical protein